MFQYSRGKMGDAAEEKPVYDDIDTRRKLISCFLCVICIALIIGLVIWFPPAHEDPSFSVRVTDAHGLDPTSGPVIWPEFNLTIRVDNTRRNAKICREEVALTVYYANTVVVGWAKVPDFCVDKWSSAELKVPLSHADVVLTNALRQRMAAELRSGDLKFGVEMRMAFPRGLIAWASNEGHESRSRQSLQVCGVKPGEAYAACLHLFLR